MDQGDVPYDDVPRASVEGRWVAVPTWSVLPTDGWRPRSCAWHGEPASAAGEVWVDNLLSGAAWSWVVRYRRVTGWPRCLRCRRARRRRAVAAVAVLLLAVVSFVLPVSAPELGQWFVGATFALAVVGVALARWASWMQISGVQLWRRDATVLGVRAADPVAVAAEFDAWVASYTTGSVEPPQSEDVTGGRFHGV